jgi:predicted esterase
MIRALVCTSAVLALLGAATTLGQKPGKDKPDAGQKKEAPAKEDPNAIDAPDVADIPTQDLRLGKDEMKRYLLDGPRKDEKQPKDGFGLLVVMPGGDGGANFHVFVKKVYKNAVPEGFLVVQPVAPKWTENPSVIWPTEKVRGDKMKFTTEEFVEGVIEEIEKTQKIDPARVFTLTWSSSGPAAYVISTRKKELVKGSLIAMSVFQPQFVDADHVKGKNYYILHSPDDQVCAFRMAEEARDFLRKKGANVEFGTYLGDHGWNDDPFGKIHKGLTWLLDPKVKQEKAEKSGKGEKEGKEKQKP